MPYSGSGKYPYWMAVGYGGTANPAVTSERVPVIADGTTLYGFSLVTQMSAGTWASGASAYLTFYNASGSVTGTSATATSGSLSAATAASWNVTPLTAPAASVSVTATLVLNGSPSAANLMQVFLAQVNQANNTSMQYTLNSNYAFTSGTSPWAGSAAAVITSGFSPLTTANGNFDSLVIADTIELMGGPGGVQSTVPELVDPATGIGAIFKISAAGGVVDIPMGSFGSAIGPYDLGTPQPTTDVIESLLLDGDRPFGYRASNRTITLPVLVFAPTLATLAAAREYLLTQIDQQTWTMTWTPASTGLAMILDCFRAAPSTVTYGFNYNREGIAADGPSGWALSLITITMPALPYGRSGLDGTQQVDFTNGLVDGSPLAAAITLDSFGPVTASIDSADGWHLSTSQYKNGPTCVYKPASLLYYPWEAAVYSKGGLSVNLAGLPVLSVWFGQSVDLAWPRDPGFSSNVMFAWTLTDSNSRTLSFRTTHNKCAWGTEPYKPAWTRLSARIPQGNPHFNYGNVTAYSVRITNWAGAGTNGLIRVSAWLDTLQATPLSVEQPATSPRGSVYTVYGLPGTARASVNAQVQLPASLPVTQELTGSGTWTVPKGVTSVFAEAWGGGGAGASLNPGSPGGGGGGGGGEYAAEPAVTVIPTVKVPFTVGSAGQPAYPDPVTVTFSTAGTHKWTCPAGVTSAEVQCWGGGGAGTAGGGGGGGGAYAGNSSVATTPGKTYTLTVGNGGRPNTGKTAADNDARNGAVTAFPGDSVTVKAQGGASPTVGASHGGDSGKGSSGGGTTVVWGGVGGASPGGAGGGGGASGNPGGRGAYGHAGSANVSIAGIGVSLGGPGGTGANGGGSGGQGASVPGIPAAGFVPGGGGGGGYTRGVNYQGGSGASGQVIITYTPATANGGTTTFGTSATASPVVTAHGGTTPVTNARHGTAGGTGSSNTAHFSGGSGGLPSGTDATYRYLSHYSMLNALASGSVTSAATGFTSSAYSGATQGTGLALIFLTASAQLASPMITDTAGNDYQCVSAPGWAAGTAWLYAFYTPLRYEVPSGATFTLTTSSTSATYAWAWYGAPTLIALEDSGSIPSGTGTGTTASVTMPAWSAAAYPNGPCQTQIVLIANNSGATITPELPAAGGLGSVTSGTMVLNASMLNTALNGSLTWTGTLGTSAAWTAVGLPFACVNQEEAITVLTVTNTTSASTTTTLAMTKAPVFQAGTSNTVIVIVQTAATSTLTVTDSLSTAFTLYASVLAGSASFLKVYAGSPSSAYTTSTTITITDSVSQTRMATAYLGYGLSGAYDASTSTGTGTAPSITPVSGSGYGDVVLVAFGNDASTATGTDPSAPVVNMGSRSSGALDFTPYFVKTAAGPDPGAVTGNYATSTTWGAVACRFAVSNAAASGGGSAAGPGGPGLTAPPGSGGAGLTGGGKGAAGPVAANAPGIAAGNPGGGGSGATATSGVQLGGTGGGGLIRLTWEPPLRPFNDFILHRPSDGAPQALSPLLSIPPSDPPDNREYVMPSLVPNASAAFGGTYSVIVVAHAWDSPGASRRLSVTVSQYEYLNGPAVSVQATRTFTPAIHTVNGYLSMGEVTLPVKDYDPSNTETYYTVSVHDTNQNDTFQDILFLDSQGTSVFCNIAPGSAGDGQYSNFYVDEPSADRDLGPVLGTGQGREHAISVLDMTFMTGGPLYVTEGGNTFLAYSTSGAPYLGLTYRPRWFLDRQQ